MGRLRFSLEFQHIREIEVRLTSIKFEFDGKHEDWLYPYLEAKTLESTVNSMFAHGAASAEYISDLDRSVLQFPTSHGEATRVANVKFQTSYAYLASSYLRIVLYIGSEPTASPSGGPLKRRLSSDTNPNFEPKEENVKSPAAKNIAVVDAGEVEVKAADVDDNAVLFGECYLSFPKLLGQEMTVFDKKDAMLLHRQIVSQRGAHRRLTWRTTFRRTSTPSTSSSPRCIGPFARPCGTAKR